MKPGKSRASLATNKRALKARRVMGIGDEVSFFQCGIESTLEFSTGKEIFLSTDVPVSSPV